MKLSKKIYYAACALLPLPLLKQVASPGTIFPYHHLISDKEVLHVKHLYSYKNIRQFGNDLDYLLKQFNPISVEELVNCINSCSPLPKNSFLLTFDDGFREVYDFVAPVLSAKGVPAIFFINPAFLDNRELFYRCKISLIIEEILKREVIKMFLGNVEKLWGTSLTRMKL
ncbi:MAG: polysaccharide deacetylase family protein [Chitinophagaceae bacterium]|nr:polysaccharide deacetylase family protein [Chitinophagaceae bacterium]